MMQEVNTELVPLESFEAATKRAAGLKLSSRYLKDLNRDVLPTRTDGDYQSIASAYIQRFNSFGQKVMAAAIIGSMSVQANERKSTPAIPLLDFCQLARDNRLARQSASSEVVYTWSKRSHRIRKAAAQYLLQSNADY